MPPRSIGCTTTGQPIRSAAARTAAASSRSSATPPVSVLWAPGAADLTTAGKPSSVAACGGRVGVAGDPLGDQRHAVGGEQLAGLGGIEPGVLRAGERALDDARRGAAVDALERGNRCRPAAAATPRAPQRVRARAPRTPGTRTRRPPSRRDSASGAPAELITTASNGLVGAAARAAVSTATATSAAVR